MESESSKFWIARNLKIVDNRIHSSTFGRLVNLIPNTGQIYLHEVMELQRGHGYPVRVILLKPRQVGWSTWCEAEGFRYVNKTPLRTMLVVSADLKSTDFVFDMTKLFQAEMPANEKLPTLTSSRKEIRYRSPHASKIITQTAGQDILGRGGTVHYFHGSEVAKWPDAKEGLAAIFQMIPYIGETTVILESTAWGQEGAFYDLFWGAVENRRRNADTYAGYIPVFFPWFKFEEYKVKVPRGFKPTEEEIALKREFPVDDEQIFWRRLKLAELDNDLTFFKQEYPATALEAFQGSGNPVFTQKMIENQESKLSKEVRYAVFKGSASGVGVENVQRTLNCWQIRQLPQAGCEYALGTDTMEARLSDPQDRNSSLDYHGATVLNRNTGEYVALFHGQCSQKDLAEQILLAGYFYNNAWIAPEMPHGILVLDLLKESGYENIYSRQVHDEQIDVDDSENLGWRTTLVTRGWLVDSFIAALRDNSITIGFESILDEMRTFIRDKTGKPIHAPSKHDDLLFAAMITLQIHLRIPLKPLAYQFDYVGEEIEEKPERERNLSMSGVHDPGLEPEEQDDMEFAEY